MLAKSCLAEFCRLCMSCACTVLDLNYTNTTTIIKAEINEVLFCLGQFVPGTLCLGAHCLFTVDKAPEVFYLTKKVQCGKIFFSWWINKMVLICLKS